MQDVTEPCNLGDRPNPQAFNCHEEETISFGCFWSIIVFNADTVVEYSTEIDWILHLRRKSILTASSIYCIISCLTSELALGVRLLVLILPYKEGNIEHALAFVATDRTPPYLRGNAKLRYIICTFKHSNRTAMLEKQRQLSC